MGSVRHRQRRSRKLLAALVAVVIVAGLGGAADLGYASFKGRAAQLQAKLTVYLQAGQSELEIDVTWSDGNGRTYKVGGSLAQDRIISLSPTGVTLTAGQPAQATLPSLSLG